MKKAQIFVSTQQNTVNVFPLLMEEFGQCMPVVVSSQVALNNHWTANLEFVLRHKGLDVIHHHLSDIDEEDSQSVDAIVRLLSSYDEVYFNISGGKKNLILLLLDAYQTRNNPQDRLIYVDNRPTAVKVFRGYKLIASHPVRFTLHLEDVLNLYGYTKLQTPAKDVVAQPAPSTDTRMSALNKYFLQDPVFIRFLYAYFGKQATEFDDKAKLKDKISQVLREHRPTLEQCKVYMDKDHKLGYETLFQDIYALKAQLQAEGRAAEKYELNKIWRKWTQLANADEIFRKHWIEVKKKLINILRDMIHQDDWILFTDQDQIRNIVKACDAITGETHEIPNLLTKNEAVKLLQLGKKHGDMFEAMFRDLIQRTLPDKQSRFESNVKVYPLGYDDAGNAFYQDFQESQNLVEFDAVYVTDYGTLVCFECKTFGFGGDLVKAKDQSSHLHGGVFSRIVLVTHLQKQHLDDPEMKDVLPIALMGQLESVKKYRVEIWYYDEIIKNLSQL